MFSLFIMRITAEWKNDIPLKGKRLFAFTV